jgi:hypothetical protein
LGSLRKIGRVGQGAIVAAIYLLTFFKAIQSGPDTWWLVGWVKANFWWQFTALLIVLAGVTPIVWVLNYVIGLNRRSATLKGVLDAFHREMSRNETRPYSLRITLFKECRKKWLNIWARSGHVTLGSRTRFRIDPNSKNRNEGIAGRCWYENVTITCRDLPDVSTQGASEESIEAYAAATFYDKEKIRSRKPKSRSLAGIPVSVNGKPWGVLVFDGESPTSVDDRLVVHMKTRILLSVVSSVLQEAKDGLDQG